MAKLNKDVTVFVVWRGEVESWQLVNRTKQGFRVVKATRYERVVPLKKVYSRVIGTVLFNTRCSFTSREEAYYFAISQILSMESYHESQLERIKTLRGKLESDHVVGA